MLNKEHIWKQLGTYEQMMLEHSYYSLTGTLRVYVACLYRLTSDKSSFCKKHGTYKDFYSMLYCCGILQSSNDVWGNCFCSLFRASTSDGDYLFYVILSCSYFCPHNGNLYIAEGRALHLPLPGGAGVHPHQKAITKEREVQVSLVLQLPNRAPILGLQRIRMPLISKG